MSDYPDWSSHGYQIISELGHNSLGGRVTYQAKQTNTQQQVVIKQFQFAAIGSTWAEYEMCEQEITLLQNIQHPHIPRYLDSFQTPDGLCIVQEYIEAQSLAAPRRWNLQDIKKVALSVLRILTYLQRQKPPIIHRDIKPENILINQQSEVYLVDFGFARSGVGEVAASSVVKGTMGFMPPEQLFNRELTAASDLYGLGVTLICLLTGTKSTDIGNLIDTNYSLHFQNLVPPLKRGWVSWLQKMVEPRVQDRYAHAAEALAALEPIDVERLPKVRLIKETLEFTGSHYPEKLTQGISISNPIPDTMLAGRWEVVPHQSDPPHTPYDHTWISFSPQKFEGNKVDCEVTVDTSQLLAGKTYIREIVLRSNSSPETNQITVIVKAAPLPQPQKPAYLMLLGLSAISWIALNFFTEFSVLWKSFHFFVLPMFVSVFVASDKVAMATAAGDRIGRGNRLKVGLGALLGSVVAACLIIWTIGFNRMFNPAVFWVFYSVGIVMGTMLGAYFGAKGKEDNQIYDAVKLLILFAVVGGALVGGFYQNIILGVLVFAITNLVFFVVYQLIQQLIQGAIAHQINKGFKPKEASQAVLLSLGLGICLALVTVESLSYLKNPRGELGDKITVALFILVPILTVIFLLIRLIARSLKNNKLIAQYLNNQQNLIKP
ncbi:MAG: serine/threonine protein kinase [Symploca sp. SIO3E6]|nr:serine/threonine protein kinase [Caldora sp. SIO3E6]